MQILEHNSIPYVTVMTPFIPQSNIMSLTVFSAISYTGLCLRVKLLRCLPDKYKVST